MDLVRKYKEEPWTDGKFRSPKKKYKILIMV